MVQILRQYGYSFIFLSVFVENFGLPLPSYPFILVAAGLAAQLHFRLPALIGLSVVAALMADEVWFVLGRLRGHPILRRLCSFSLYPDSCVSRTEGAFERYGLKSLLVAKFLPGLNTVAAPLAGMLRVSPLRFTLFDLGGTGLWVGSAVALGLIFRTQLEWLTEWLTAFGKAGLLILLVLLAGWILLKWVQRRQFYRSLAKARISPAALKERMDRGEDLVIVDLRSDISYLVQGVKIPGALRIPPEEFAARHQEIRRGRPVVMYCT